jgi:hypothetical protein
MSRTFGDDICVGATRVWRVGKSASSVHWIGSRSSLPSAPAPSSQSDVLVTCLLSVRFTLSLDVTDRCRYRCTRSMSFAPPRRPNVQRVASASAIRFSRTRPMPSSASAESRSPATTIPIANASIATTARRPSESGPTFSRQALSDHTPRLTGRSLDIAKPNSSSCVSKRPASAAPVVAKGSRRTKRVLFSHLATVELQVIMQCLDLQSALTLARCSRFTLACASSEFAFKYVTLNLKASSDDIPRILRPPLSYVNLALRWVAADEDQAETPMSQEELTLLASLKQLRTLDIADRFSRHGIYIDVLCLERLPRLHHLNVGFYGPTLNLSQIVQHLPDLRSICMILEGDHGSNFL